MWFLEKNMRSIRLLSVEQRHKYLLFMTAERISPNAAPNFEKTAPNSKNGFGGVHLERAFGVIFQPF